MSDMSIEEFIEKSCNSLADEIITKIDDKIERMQSGIGHPTLHLDKIKMTTLIILAYKIFFQCEIDDKQPKDLLKDFNDQIQYRLLRWCADETLKPFKENK